MFPGPLGHSLAGKALENGIWSLETIQIRDFATDRHHSVDDTPFGGGAGMVLRPDVIDAALDRVADERPILCLTPRGRQFCQADAVRLAGGDGVDPVVRPLRGHRPTRDRSPRHGGNQRRRLRPVGRRARRAGRCWTPSSACCPA